MATNYQRTIRPKDETDDSPGVLSSTPEAPNPNKRKCISSACIPCRKRKSKCDGGLPHCSTCTAVYHTTCSYDVDSDHRRKSALKKDIATLRGEKESLVVIVTAIKSSSDAEVADIVQQIRANESLDTIAETLRRNLTLPENYHGSAEAELSNLIGRTAFDVTGVRHYGHTSSLGLVSDTEHSPVHLPNSEAWTTVTQDISLVEHLLNLYFSWVHPFYSLFSKEMFLDDMANNRTKYCSSLLVNAVLSVACSYSDKPVTRADHDDPSTAGDEFFAEAKRLLHDHETAKMTTVQALALMGLREASCNHESSGFQYAGRCMRMCIELGLHLSYDSDKDRFTPMELEARKITFWGCYTYDTAWSICIGRISQLPRAAITIDKPKINEAHELQAWKVYSDYGEMDVEGSRQPTHALSLSHQFSSLSEIVNDHLFMFYAPRERRTSKNLLDLYGRYKEWFTSLPEKFQIRDVNTPHVLILHMYYSSVVILLFRPYLKVDLANSRISPREICITYADNAATLLATYRRIYGLRRIPLLAAHVVLTFGIIHLLHLPSPSPARWLAQSIASLREMSVNHAFAFRGLRIIMKLADQWNIQLPPEVERAANDIPPEVSLDHSKNAHAHTSYLSPISNPPQPYGLANGKVTAGDVSFAAKTNPKPYLPVEEIYWSPFADGSLPFPAHLPRGPMDRMEINNMLSVPNNHWDQLTQDGFRFPAHGDWGYDTAVFPANVQWPQR